MKDFILSAVNEERCKQHILSFFSLLISEEKAGNSHLDEMPTNWNSRKKQDMVGNRSAQGNLESKGKIDIYV